MPTRWEDLVEHQRGVLSRRQALLGGMTRSEWAWGVSSGRWQRVLPGVVLMHTGAATDEERLWAAWASAGPGAALAGDAALVRHGFAVKDLRRYDVAVPLGRRLSTRRFRDGGTVVPRRLSQAERPAAEVDGLPTTTREIALLLASEWAPSDRAAEWRLAACVQQGLVQPGAVREALPELAALTRAPLIATVLQDVEKGAQATSELEFLRFCRQFGLPEPDQLQVLVRAGGTRYLDARYHRQRVTVEVDGAHHRDADQWHADAMRSLHLLVALPGERVIRLTTSMLRHDGPEVAELLRQVLA